MVYLNSKKLSMTSSLLLISSAILIGLSSLFPWWKLLLYAPQYPEGLNIIVYPNKLEGQIDIINGLNHYIGMQNFSEKSFPELAFLNYLIIGLAVLTLIVGLLRRKSFLYMLIGLFLVGGLLGVYDLYQALHTFGSNLDPHAPIKIKPFVPPMVGENHFANFTTHSYLGKGAYLIVLSFVLTLIPLWKDRK
jgi:copper chaperone NosL